MNNNKPSIQKLMGHDFSEHSPLCERGFALTFRDIFVKKTNGKSLKIFSAGDVVDIAILKKLMLMPASEISSQSFLDIEILKEGQSLLRSVKESNEDNFSEHRKAFLNFVQSHFLNEKSQTPFLLLIAIVSDFYYDFNEQQTNKLLAHSLEDYKIGCIRAAMSVVFLIALEITNQNFVQDLYRLSFLFDLGLDFSNTFSREFNLDKIKGEQTEQTIPYLNKNWVEHPVLSEKTIEDEWKSLFKTQGIIKLVKFHHENIYGRGESTHLNFHEMSDLEAVVILLGHIEGILPQSNISEVSSSQYLKEIFDDKYISEGCLSPRIKHRILNAFDKNIDMEAR